MSHIHSRRRLLSSLAAGFSGITASGWFPLFAEQQLAPILLHLFDRRRNVTIEWGAMEFLLEAATRRTSAGKLKQWLLLLLRVLAIAALVMALARDGARSADVARELVRQP